MAIQTRNNGKQADEAGFFQELDSLVDRARSELERIEEARAVEVEAHKHRLAQFDAQRRRVRSYLRAVDPTPRTSRKPSVEYARKRTSAFGGVSAKTLLVILEAIENRDDLFSALGIHEELRAPWSEPHTYMAFSHLRKIEYIGKAGKGTDHRERFRILDPQLGQKLKASLQESVSAHA